MQSEWQKKYNELAILQKQTEQQVSIWKHKYFDERNLRQSLTLQLIQQIHNQRKTNPDITVAPSSITSGQISDLDSTIPSFDLDEEEDHNDATQMLQRSMSTSDIMKANTHKKTLLRSLSSSNDLWSLRSERHLPKLSSLRKALLLLKVKKAKEHLFEHFFVSGVSLDSHEIQRTISKAETLKHGFKPQILFMHPPSNVGQAGSVTESSVPDFCFPLGVPLQICSAKEADSKTGSLVSTWNFQQKEMESEFLSDAHCYTFRLTGAEGESLYGFCATVLEPICSSTADMYSKSEDCNTPMDSKHNPFTWKSSSQIGNVELVAPRCYCITSKYPFYKLFFQILREVLQIEMEKRRSQRHKILERQRDQLVQRDSYEIVVSSHGSLGLVLKNNSLHRPAETLPQHGSTTDSTHKVLSAIALPLNPNMGGVCLLREDNCFNSDGEECRDENSANTNVRRRLRSHSWSGSKPTNSAHECKLPPPEVVGFDVTQAGTHDWYQIVRVGDLLEEVNGKSTRTMTFKETIHTIRSSARPFSMKFSRPIYTTLSQQNSDSQQEDYQQEDAAGPKVHEFLLKVRDIGVREPGQWIDITIPSSPPFSFRYQFPLEDTEKWTCGVVLRALSPSNLVRVLTCLLLEKQVVICSESTAKLSAAATAMKVMLSPFVWQSTFIPVLPSHLLEVLHAPVPYIIGTHHVASTEEWDGTIFADLDSDKVVVPPEMGHYDQDFLPDGAQICSSLKNYGKELQALHNISRPLHEPTNSEIALILAATTTLNLRLKGMCGDVEQYCSSSNSRFATNFSKEKYLQMAQTTKQRDFLELFSETQMFCHYCEEIMLANQ